MKKADVPGHRTRSRAVFYSIANEVVAAPLVANLVSFTDVVTLIEMRENATVNVLIDQEPMTWLLFNKFVDLANDQFRGRGHGNYLPAIEAAGGIFQRTVRTNGKNVALFLLFLSDGKPSDHVKLRIAAHEQAAYIRKSMYKLCTSMRSVAKNFTFGAFGFANDMSNEFDVMKQMKAEAERFGITSIFEQGLDSRVLRKALHMMSKSLTSTITAMSSLINSKPPKTLVSRSRPGHVPAHKSEDKSTADIASSHNIIEQGKCYWYIIGTLFELEGSWSKVRVRRFELANKADRKAKKDEDGFIETLLLHHKKGARGIAFSKKYIGRGAEREARLMTEINYAGQPIGQPLVAKFDIRDKTAGQLHFHKIFGRTQRQASRLARKFNESLDRHGIPKRFARIQFLDCSFYTTYTTSEGEWGLLCEDYLPAGRWKKWTDNRGGIHNVAKCTPVLEPASKGRPGPTTVMASLAESEEEEEVESDEDLFEDSASKPPPVRQMLTFADRQLFRRILDEDILLAFSHWTHFYTKRDCLVCDLQGVHFDGANPVFKLTDPAIHSKKPGRYGSTDHGRKGQNAFFKNHTCNSVCKLLRLDSTSRC